MFLNPLVSSSPFDFTQGYDESFPPYQGGGLFVVFFFFSSSVWQYSVNILKAEQRYKARGSGGTRLPAGRQAYGDDDIRHNVGLGSWTPRAFATFGHKSRKKDSNTEK
ncbi:hypothetical protein KKA33_04200, partial [Patescibacteria group bacterium]|nr:hypothetical protein [Patescibacteria group bacterium]